MKITIRNIVFILLGSLLLVLLTTCRASKSENVNLAQTENIVQDMKSHSIGKSNLQTDIKTIIEKVLSESMGIKKKETEYDTEKPVLPETGKPPVKKETELTLSQKKEEETHFNESNISTRNDVAESANHAAINASIDRSIESTSERNIQKESDIFLKWVGGITIFLVVLILILCILGKSLKKRLQNFL
ncbi:hypothetical protein CLV62_104156 [Dysgonomonas alginatilytica]|uniref:Uncharacterized protein n=1 Tax=Dysgonomonas alginatilytica TaxID=1605892 RepID=A0A2V3PUA1_9BACT|nr:hypothetical protein [Dysgonomonas alginatilytica]PXV66895.1 hypothetical protein CLV62_104156 [Dysgonomonas alginatilytica]